MNSKLYSILYLNLVSEMIYVVAERLKTQKIPIHKSILVLNDIVAAAFSSNLSLFTEKHIHTRKQITKSLSDAIHSSIMRLNDSSMEKLMGLIETSVKMQMYSANGPRQILHITLNHLDSVRLITSKTRLKQVINIVHHNFTQIYGKMTDGEILRLRYSILNYFQDINVKVTVFIKEGLQRYNGSFVTVGKWTIPYGGEVPGAIRIFDKNGKLNDISTFNPISSYKVETEIGSLEINSPRNTTLGLSLYKTYANDNGVSETSDPLFYDQTGRHGYKHEIDLFVTQLIGTAAPKDENIDVELPSSSFSVVQRRKAWKLFHR
ncbi:protein OSCP1-like isoform X2 [Daktulosphaira vitifoliae]|uniref:protein OSCP1-like isoform X2 n=1 Tax=Daktulosphaira vitifoliae TaxID=58002 RepID=UPI0021A9DA65|nr:protein OSCP1-like isoform X2 [Daktulosphaira vitifoliae]